MRLEKLSLKTRDDIQKFYHAFLALKIKPEDLFKCFIIDAEGQTCFRRDVDEDYLKVGFQSQLLNKPLADIILQSVSDPDDHLLFAKFPRNISNHLSLIPLAAKLPNAPTIDFEDHFELTLNEQDVPREVIYNQTLSETMYGLLSEAIVKKKNIPKALGYESVEHFKTMLGIQKRKLEEAEIMFHGLIEPEKKIQWKITREKIKNRINEFFRKNTLEKLYLPLGVILGLILFVTIFFSPLSGIIFGKIFLLLAALQIAPTSIVQYLLINIYAASTMSTITSYLSILLFEGMYKLLRWGFDKKIEAYRLKKEMKILKLQRLKSSYLIKNPLQPISNQIQKTIDLTKSMEEPNQPDIKKIPEENVRPHQNYTDPNAKYILFMKTLRCDEKCYLDQFAKSVIRLPGDEIKNTLRPVQKEAFYLTPEGTVIPRSDKPSQKINKAEFSPKQSMTLITETIEPEPFGFDRRREKLAGVIIPIEDTLTAWPLLSIDSGTCVRWWNTKEVNTLIGMFEARKHTIFSDINSLIDAIIVGHKRHNETLMRVRFSKNGMVGVFSNSLPARIFAQHIAQILRDRLKEKAKRQQLSLDDGFQVRIIFYLPEEALHLSDYDLEAQKKDISKINYDAKTAFLDWMDNKFFEYFLVLDRKTFENVNEQYFEKREISIIGKLLQLGYRYHAQVLLQKLYGNDLAALTTEEFEKIYPYAYDAIWDLDWKILNKLLIVSEKLQKVCQSHKTQKDIFFRALDQGNLDVAKYILKFNRALLNSNDPNCAVLYNRRNFFFATPLARSHLLENKKMMEWLLKERVNIFSQAGNGSIVGRKFFKPIKKLFPTLFVDKIYLAPENQNILMTAIESDNIELAKLLIQTQPHLISQEKDYCTPIELAAHLCRVNMVKLLLPHLHPKQFKPAIKFLPKM